ncbi:MliC family protein, partial [Mycobacterium tuberculosis]|nr:MliC family protein [Mycobacterium tuberculosis]
MTGKVEGKRMKKILIAVVPFMLAGCSYYNQFVERMQTDTLEYQCDQKPLTVHRNNARQQVSFIYDNQQLNLSEGLSASGARYT